MLAGATGRQRLRPSCLPTLSPCLPDLHRRWYERRRDGSGQWAVELRGNGGGSAVNTFLSAADSEKSIVLFGGERCASLYMCSRLKRELRDSGWDFGMRGRGDLG